MADQYLSTIAQGELDTSIDLMDYSQFLDFASGDPTDPIGLSLYDEDPSAPSSWNIGVPDLANSNFTPATKETYVNPSDLEGILSLDPVSLASTPPLPIPIFVHDALAPRRTKKVESGYPCVHPGCGRRFDRACDLRKHAQRTHTPHEQRACKCPHCDSRFNWPKDVARHCRQVHGEGDDALSFASLPESSVAASIQYVATNAGLPRESPKKSKKTQQRQQQQQQQQTEKSGPPAKRQRQLRIAAIPKKLSTALWLCRSIVMLQGLKLRSKSRDEDPDVAPPTGHGDGMAEEFYEDVKPPSPSATATTTTSTMTVTAPRQPSYRADRRSRRVVLITRDRRDFRAVDVSRAESAGAVLAAIRAAAGVSDATHAISVSAFTWRDGVEDALAGEGLMNAVAERAGGDGTGLMLFLTVVKKEGA